MTNYLSLNKDKLTGGYLARPLLCLNAGLCKVLCGTLWYLKSARKMLY